LLHSRHANLGGMSMTTVSSSAIRAIGYNGSTLRVEFHNSGVYDHPGVPYELYARFMRSSSKGAFYNQYIRGRY
jgi:hypothetical protein